MRSATRKDDMGTGSLKLMQCEDGDVHVSLVLPGHGFLDAEFCVPGTGGGKSPRTWRALVELLRAMQDDDTDDARRGR